MKNKECEIDEGRRKALAKIAVGVGVLAGCAVLPEQWTRPIVGQIVLPAHAATSGSTLHDPCSIELRGGDTTTTSVTIKVNGFVTPPTNNLPVHIVATPTGGSGVSVNADTVTDAGGNFTAFLTIGGGPGITAVSVTTAVTGAAGTARCSVNVGAAPPAPPALTPCTLTLRAGNQSTTAIEFLLTGSVNPPMPNVQIDIIFTTNLTNQPSSIQTGPSGIFDTGYLENFGPGCQFITATITSPVATGTTTCTINIPV